jgi:hypothetical protein
LKGKTMQTNTAVLEAIQSITGTSDNTIVGGNSIFNSTLPTLLPEYQKLKRVSEKCVEITDSVKDLDGGSMLISAVADVQQKCDANLLALKMKISKEYSDNLEHVDRHAFQLLDKDVWGDFLAFFRGDSVLRTVLEVEAAKLKAAQTTPNQQQQHRTYL